MGSQQKRREAVAVQHGACGATSQQPRRSAHHRHPASGGGGPCMPLCEERPLCHARGTRWCDSACTPRALLHSLACRPSFVGVGAKKRKKERKKEKRGAAGVQSKQNGTGASAASIIAGLTSYEFSNSQQIRTYSYSRYFSSYVTARFPLIIMQTKKGTPRGSLGWIG